MFSFIVMRSLVQLLGHGCLCVKIYTLNQTRSTCYTDNLLFFLSDAKFQAMRRTPSPDNTRGITIAAAKFSSEDAAVLVQYTIAIIEYTRLCGPLRSSLEKQHKLEREIEENERIAREKANQVRDQLS